MDKKEFEERFLLPKRKYQISSWGMHGSPTLVWQWIEEQTKELQKDRDIYFEIAVDAIGEERVENIRQFILGLKTLEQKELSK